MPSSTASDWAARMYVVRGRLITLDNKEKAHNENHRHAHHANELHALRTKRALLMDEYLHLHKQWWALTKRHHRTVLKPLVRLSHLYPTYTRY